MGSNPAASSFRASNKRSHANVAHDFPLLLYRFVYFYFLETSSCFIPRQLQYVMSAKPSPTLICKVINHLSGLLQSGSRCVLCSLLSLFRCRARSVHKHVFPNNPRFYRCACSASTGLSCCITVHAKALLKFNKEPFVEQNLTKIESHVWPLLRRSGITDCPTMRWARASVKLCLRTKRSARLIWTHSPIRYLCCSCEEPDFSRFAQVSVSLNFSFGRVRWCQQWWEQLVF